MIYMNNILHKYNLFSYGSHSRCLDKEEVALLTTVCATLDMPVQEPVAVCFQKRVTKEDPLTGRIIEYVTLQKAVCSSTTCASYVALSRQDHMEIGHIDSLFTYRSKVFAVIVKYEGVIHNVYGLLHIPDTTSQVKLIAHIEALSRPLAIARDSNELWILNL